MSTAASHDLEFDVWREAISSAFVPLDAAPLVGAPTAFSGGLASRELGDLQLSEVLGASAWVRRTASTIRRADPGVIKVALQLSGHSTVSQAGREAELGPGDLAVYDTSRRYELALADSFDILVAVIPRETLRINDSELDDGVARTITSCTGVGALLRPMLCALREQSLGEESMAPQGMSAQSLVTDAVADLVSACLRAAVPDTGIGAGDTVLMSARTYIEGHLGDPFLTPAAVAAHHHVSLRYLQKLFAQDGDTVAGFIRRLRLERCRGDLADPLQIHRSVGAICAANGLVEAAHFSRIFKSAYGMSPRQYRDSHLPAAG
ncbi:helix-turn-helix domain-containing protein [Gordonia sp. N1V]|uniref:AraC-like ligand-binding domain-containing protein n=1 Tax=Gordonia sp. N1V TaxID=3034163 RepID=UPI0023E1C83B|nr:helix-turn-helix domain-containing protein [Gordonia sp. N1V]MDF3283592.1 helix-turn-helix domain-containing protein [Gordonia sp. N1V]